MAFLWPTPEYPGRGRAGKPQLVSLTKSGYSLDDYWPGLLESAKYQGSVYGFHTTSKRPSSTTTRTCSTRPAFRLSDENWTWDDLTAAAEKLTVKDTSGTTTQYALAMEGGLGKWSKWVLPNGGSILDDMSNPSKCTIDEPAAIEAITFSRS